MRDLEIRLDNRPGALARMGATLGVAGVSLEGGGAWVTGAQGTAHFLVHGDGLAACEALEAAGIEVVAVRQVLQQRLRQDRPGQLGALCACMAEAGVNIEVLYSDHDQQLTLVVDDMEAGRAVTAAWAHGSDKT